MPKERFTQGQEEYRYFGKRSQVDEQRPDLDHLDVANMLKSMGLEEVYYLDSNGNLVGFSPNSPLIK